MIKRFDINPCVSVGEIQFGMQRDDVRKIFGNFSEYKDREDDDNTADYFDLCQCFYSSNNELEFVMFHALDSVELMFQGLMLNKMKKSDLIDYFSKLDNDLIAETGFTSITSNNYGIACWFTREIDFENDEVDEFDEEDDFMVDKLETISVAIKNYWK